jgi:hypothetical protein
MTGSGLPDGLFSNPNSQFGSILEGVEIYNLCIFYDHLVYFAANGNILRPFGLFCGHLVYFPRFGILYHEKSGNPERAGAALVQSDFYTNSSGHSAWDRSGKLEAFLIGAAGGPML